MNTPPIPTDEALMQHISETLIELGILLKYKGFNYVKDAIYLWMNTPIESDAYKSILKIVGQKYSIAPMSVNGAIKNALDSAWFCGTVNKAHELFGYLKSNQLDNDTLITAEQIKALQKRNAQLEEENLILKKAIAIFTPHSGKD